MLHLLLSQNILNYTQLFVIFLAQVLAIFILYNLSKLTFQFAYTITSEIFTSVTSQFLPDIEGKSEGYYENILINETGRFSLNVFQGSIDIFVRLLIVIAMCIPFLFQGDLNLIVILLAVLMMFGVIIFFVKSSFATIGAQITALNESVVKFVTTTFDRIVYLQGTNRIRVFRSDFKRLMKRFASVQATNQFLLKSPKYILEFFVFIAGIVYLTLNKGQIEGSAIPSFFALMKILPSLQTIYQLYGKVNVHYPSMSIIKGHMNIDTVFSDSGSLIRDTKDIRRIVFSGKVNVYDPGSKVNEFTFERGKVYAVVGESGIGKSTLFKLLLGLFPMSYSAVRLNGEVMSPSVSSMMRDRTMMLTQTVFFTDDDIKKLNELSMASKQEYGELFRIDLSRKISSNASNMSGGQRQRLGLILALIEQPQFLFIDEAFSGFNDELAVALLAKIKVILPESFIWFISHNKRLIIEADEICQVR